MVGDHGGGRLERDVAHDGAGIAPLCALLFEEASSGWRSSAPTGSWSSACYAGGIPSGAVGMVIR